MMPYTDALGGLILCIESNTAAVVQLPGALTPGCCRPMPTINLAHWSTYQQFLAENATCHQAKSARLVSSTQPTRGSR